MPQVQVPQVPVPLGRIARAGALGRAMALWRAGALCRAWALCRAGALVRPAAPRQLAKTPKVSKAEAGKAWRWLWQ